VNPLRLGFLLNGQAAPPFDEGAGITVDEIADFRKPVGPQDVGIHRHLRNSFTFACYHAVAATAAE
jgi:hypothetical protein